MCIKHKFIVNHELNASHGNRKPKMESKNIGNLILNIVLLFTIS